MAFSSPVLNAHPARTRPRGAAPALPATAAATNGRELWLEHCAGCHGADGRGDGPAAAWLRPRPTDLTLRRFADEQLADVLWNGVLGTSMPAWRGQPPANLAALAAIVRTFASSDDLPAAPDQLDAGSRVYQAHCAECHGATGAGDGFAAGELPIAPTDFRRQRATLAESLRALATGVEGTSMAPWTGRLSGDELMAVSHYVRSLFAAEGP